MGIFRRKRLGEEERADVAHRNRLLKFVRSQFKGADGRCSIVD
jgi:hypothetical protein